MIMNDYIYILENGVRYLLDQASNTASVVASADGEYKGNVVIAPKVCHGEETFTVMFIAEKAFAQCKELRSVDIPNTMECIGWYAFHVCTGLTAIHIPGSIKDMGWGAFEGCTNLSAVTIAEGVQTIGVSAFAHCANLKTITLPDSVRKIFPWAFA